MTELFGWINPYLQYSALCLPQEVTTIVCQPFWLVVAHTSFAAAALILTRILYVSWLWHRNAKLVARRKAQQAEVNEQAIEETRWRGEECTEEISQLPEQELASQFRKALLRVTRQRLK